VRKFKNLRNVLWEENCADTEIFDSFIPKSEGTGSPTDNPFMIIDSPLLAELTL